MWWRILLFVVALACTFQRKVTADNDDVLCVILLSGLKKDDLDVNLLKKLQRHKVNIDDIYNRKTIEKCIQRTDLNISNENGYDEEKVPTKSEQSEQMSTRVKYNKNTMQIEEIPKETENKSNFKKSKVENSAYAELTPSYENFVKLWKSINKTRHQDNEVNKSTVNEKSMTVKLPLSFEKGTNSDYQATSVDLVNKMLERYISARKTVTTTIKSSTANQWPENQVDLVSQQIMKYLTNDHNKNRVGGGSEEILSEPTNEVKYKVNKTIRVQEIPKYNADKINRNTIETEYSVSKNTLRTSSFDHFIDFMTKLNKIDHQNNENITAKDIEMRVTIQPSFQKDTKADSQAKDISFIHNMLENYISEQTKVTTTKPTTTEKQIDIVLQLIKNLIQDNSNYKTALVNRVPEDINKNRSSDINNMRDDRLLMRTNNPNHQNIINKTAVETEKNMVIQTPVEFYKEPQADSQAKDIDFIHTWLKTYISQPTIVTTIKPTTTEKQIDIVSQQIKNFIQDNINHKKVLVEDRIPEEINKNRNVDINDLRDDKLLLRICNTNDQSNKNKTAKETEKGITIQLPVTFDEEDKANSQAKDIVLIYNMLERYLSLQKKVTTIKPAVTEKQIDIMSQQIKNFLQHNINRETALVGQVPEEIKKDRNLDINNLHDDKLVNTGLMIRDSISDKLIAQNYQSNIPGFLARHFEDANGLKNNINNDKTRKYVSERKTSTLHNNANIDPRLRYIETFKAYIIADKLKQTSTQQPTTTPKHIDLDLNQFLETIATNNTKIKDYNEPNFFWKEVLNAYNNEQELRNQDQSIIPRPIKSKFKDEQVDNLQFIKAKDDLPVTKEVERNSYQQQSPITSNNEIAEYFNSKELIYLFHKFKDYIATKNADATKSVPSTTSKHIHDIAQKIKILDTNSSRYRRNKATQVPYQNIEVKSLKINTTEDKGSHVTRKVDYMKELQRQANQLKISNIFEITSKDVLQSNSSRLHNNTVKKYKFNNNITTESKSLPDIIKEITEKVKASVLQDLQKQISTTLRTVFEGTTAKITTPPTITSSTTTPTTTTTSPLATSTKIVHNIHNVTTGSDNIKETSRFIKESDVETTTVLSSVSTKLKTNQDKIKTAKNALENFINLFEEFRYIKDDMTSPNDQNSISQTRKIKNEFHGPINVVYPCLLPVDYAYNSNNTPVTPLFVNPNGNNTPVKPLCVNPCGVQINNPMVQKTTITREFKKYIYSVDPQNKTENKMEHAIQAAIIQTDDSQVPLLGIPVPRSVSPINQNIIVTTKHPMIQFREEQEHKSKVHMQNPRYQDHTVNGRGKYDTDWNRHPERDFGKQYEADTQSHLNTDVTKYDNDRFRGYRNWREKYPYFDHKNIINRKRQSPRNSQANAAADNFYQEYVSDTKRQSPKSKQANTGSDNFYQEYLSNINRQPLMGNQANTGLDNYYQEYLSDIDRQSKRSKQANTGADNLYQEYESDVKPKSGKPWEFPQFFQEPKTERYYEKLERPYGWQHIREAPKKEKRLKVFSRQQLPLSGLKNKKRYDSHYVNFLKSQQRVDDMLENILKPSDRVRSVEAM